MITINDARTLVFQEMFNTVFDSKKLELLLQYLLHAKQIFLIGHGRSGLVAKMFANRLLHLGLNPHVIGEITCPPIKSNDFLLIVSGSGSSQALVQVATMTHHIQATVGLITASNDSPLAKLANVKVVIEADSKKVTAKFSKQPMGTKFEQGALVSLEASVLYLQEKLKLSEKMMEQNHANVE
jgi:6-phospho-3-hexuloisomerase